MPSEDSKPVKKEEDKKSSVSKKITSSNAKPQTKVAKAKKEEPEPEAINCSRPVKAPTSASRSKVSEAKKEQYDDIEDDDDKPLAKRSSLSKELKKKKKIKEGEKKKEETAAGQKRRERKVYDLPGQKRDPPEEKDPLRIFYETLYKQVPSSEMSQLWLMESGLLPEEVAMKVNEKRQKRGLQQKISSPVKAVSAVKSSTRSVTIKKNKPSSSVPSAKKKTMDSTLKPSKKRQAEEKSSEDDSDDNIVLSLAKRRKAA